MATTATTTEDSSSSSQQPPSDPHFDLYLAIVANQSKLSPQEYVSEELSRRFTCVSGQILCEFLQNDLDLPALLKTTPSLSHFEPTADADQEEVFQEAINQMIDKNLFKRVVPLTVNKKKYGTNTTIKTNFAQKSSQIFDPDGLYAFIIQPQPQFALAKSLAIVGGVIAIACFKIWPIILRIGLWWLLLFTTVFLITAIIIHLLSKILFTLMCLRGYSFMPNLLDEEIGFFETFSPILGSGGEHQRRWALEREIQVRARQKLGLGKKDVVKKEQEGIAFTADEGAVAEADKNDKNTDKTTDKNTDKNGQNGQPTKDSKDSKDSKDLKDLPLSLPPQNIFHTWQAGLFAFIVFFILGAIGAYNMGFFDPEMVPDFLVNNNEMRYYFPAIAATSTEDGVVEEVVGKTEFVDLGEEISM